MRKPGDSLQFVPRMGKGAWERAKQFSEAVPGRQSARIRDFKGNSAVSCNELGSRCFPKPYNKTLAWQTPCL